MSKCAHCHASIDPTVNGLTLSWIFAVEDIEINEEFCGWLCAAAYCASMSDHSLVCGIDKDDYLQARHHDGVNSEEDCPPIPPYKAELSPRGKGALLMDQTKEFDQ